jgi:predicted DNA-binding transcriptional regulator YafY
MRRRVEDVRASRLVQLLLLLQTNGKMTAARLADELEVSVRTIYRDIEALSGAGVPIYAEAGPGGGVRLVDGYRTRLTGLTAEEAEALALSGLPGAASELGLGTVLAAAQLKVDAALPPELRSRAVRMRERFHLDAPGWFAREEPVPHLAALSRAVWEERRLELRYAKGDGEVRRAVDPLGLVLKAGVWYLVARSGRTQSLRTFRVSRVVGVRELDEEVQRPEDFDLARHWTEAGEAFFETMHNLDVRVRLRRSRLGWLRSFLAPADARAVIEGAPEPDADGWVEVTLPFELQDQAAHELLRLGAEVEVLDPPELREQVAATISAMAARYAVA